ncbi:Aste57867_977 [Aphanomyces stellatus]|uniref:Aste57867_977 protein n=1 Tax=Aphanomyces stellatus TaxID=120398 RepID=A0A485K9H1_9STRA|nr:hypothetical protein As57867_000976 [Aphanomyces stellatus]VFT78199.1 Aste57867_977 [Aphanomyces stellatus]
MVEHESAPTTKSGGDLTKHSIFKSMFRGSDDESSEEESSDDSDADEARASASTTAAAAAGTDPNDEISAYEAIHHDFRILLRQERKKGIAHQLWPAATFLSHYLEQHASTLLSTDTSVVELGAGIGLCGLVCHKLQARHVFLTDLPVAVPLLDANIALNCAGDDESRIHAAVLGWGSATDLAAVMAQMPANGPRLCIAADCVYWEELFEPFFETVRALVVDHGVDVILAHVKRWKRDEKFFKLCRKHMTVTQLVEDVGVEMNEHTQASQRVIKRIFRLSAK